MCIYLLHIYSKAQPDQISSSRNFKFRFVEFVPALHGADGSIERDDIHLDRLLRCPQQPEVVPHDFSRSPGLTLW